MELAYVHHLHTKQSQFGLPEIGLEDPRFCIEPSPIYLVVDLWPASNRKGLAGLHVLGPEPSLVEEGVPMLVQPWQESLKPRLEQSKLEPAFFGDG